MLPERTNEYLFANIETIMQRPAFQESLEYALDDFVGANEKAPSEALLRSSAITALAFGSARGDESSEWYCVLRGDFTLINEALSIAAMMSGDNPFTELVEVHLGVEIFGVFFDDGYHALDELYLVVPDMNTMALTKDLDGAREMAERWLAGSELPTAFARMLRDWGRVDYINAFRVDRQVGSAPPSPLDTVEFGGIYVTLLPDSTSAVGELRQLGSGEQAEAAAAWLNEQPEPYYRRIGYSPGFRIEQWEYRESIVYGHGVVPDDYVERVIGSN